MCKKENELHRTMKLKLGITRDEAFFKIIPIEIESFKDTMSDYYLLIKNWINKIPQFLQKYPDIESYLKSSDPEERKYGQTLEDDIIEDSQKYFEIYPRMAINSFIISLNSGFESMVTELCNGLNCDSYNTEEGKSDIKGKIKNDFKSAGINLDLGTNRCWSAIVDFVRIRNVLVHLNGNIRKMREIINKCDIEKHKHGKQLKNAYEYIVKHPQYFDISHEYLIIKIDTRENYCTYSIDNITKILSYLFSCAQTKYDSNKR